jgi:hypothetical protein
MTSSKRRLDKLEISLTPKQAILLWMEEAHKYDTMEQYARSLKPGPESAWPLATLPEKVATGVEQAMKGRPRREVARTARQAIRDVLFLFHLHQRINQKFMEEQRQFWARALLLWRELEAMHRERQLRDRMTWNWFKIGLELPYPLGPEAAAAVEAMKEHYVLTWDLIEEGDEITAWVQEYFVDQGRTTLPEGAYSLQERDEQSFNSSAEEVVRGVFSKEAEFQKFLVGEDYSYYLADVADQEFEAKRCSVLQAIKDQAASREVQEGAVIELPSVPHQLLRDAPLVEGQWIDWHVVALAEWGARLQGRGYHLQEPEDSHPLAWHCILGPGTGEEVEASVLDKLWQQTQKQLDRFSGRTSDIQGRPYLHYQDYGRWRGRKAKGQLGSGLRRGLVLNSWNQWVAANGGEGEASLESVGVSCLSSYLEGFRYHLCRDEYEAMEERRRRESPLEPLRIWKPGGGNDRYQQRSTSWKGMAEVLLLEVWSFQETVNTIRQRYFDGHQVLFPSSAGDFNRLLECLEELVESYNEKYTNKLEQFSEPSQEFPQPTQRQRSIETAGLRKVVVPAAQGQMNFLVDLSRAEALDATGESQKALELIDRHV